MRHLGYLLIGWAVFGLLSLSVTAQDRIDTARDEGKTAEIVGGSGLACTKHFDGKRVVFVINGGNGSTQASDHMLEVNAEFGLGLKIEVVNWSRHDSRYRDMVDMEAQLVAAYRVSCATTAIRKQCPRAQIFYVGYSAGARVALAAAEMAGPNSVDRIFLMHAAVSACYDLNNALRASRHGIDSYYSIDDLVLEVAGDQYALADGAKGAAAGHTGFRPPADKRGVEPYCNLRQIAWNQDYAGLGGHCAWPISHNLKRTVMPLILNTPSGEPAFSPAPGRIDPRSPP